MTFCLGLRVEEGLVGIADTRITSGTECISARKVTVHRYGRYPLFVMTSGLRSVRDKAITYFEEYLEDSDLVVDRLYKAVNALAQQLRRVAEEDRAALEASSLTFNLQALIGGQLEKDKEHKLYLLYPQGNWVEVSRGSPYYIIGESGYGKPILDRTLKYTDSMQFALKVGCLAFDSTRISANNVDFPLDIVLYRRDTFELVEHRYEKADLIEISNWWQERLRGCVDQLPDQWQAAAFDKLNQVLPETIPLPSGS